MSNYQTLTRWITYVNDGETIDLGIIPAPAMVLNPFLIVKTGFNGSSTDLLRVGTPSNDDAFGTDFDVSSSFSSPTLFAAGVGLGYLAAGVKAQMKYSSNSGNPLAGEALVVLPYLKVPYIL